MIRLKLAGAAILGASSLAGFGGHAVPRPVIPGQPAPAGGSAYIVRVNGATVISTPFRDVAMATLSHELDDSPLGVQVSIVHVCPSCR